MTPEILDELPADHPEAVRSRGDLRRINALMGNFRWIRRVLGGLPVELRRSMIEIGSGDGGFLETIGEEVGTVTGIDLAPRPKGLRDGIDWVRGDVFLSLPGVGGERDVLVANLFLHHFEDGRLEQLGPLLRRFKALCISEPWRSRTALAGGYALFPFVNRVTRHDMPVSIRAGFVPGELPRLLGLGSEWHAREEVSLLGACRLLAWKRR